MDFMLEHNTPYSKLLGSMPLDDNDGPFLDVSLHSMFTDNHSFSGNPSAV